MPEARDPLADLTAAVRRKDEVIRAMHVARAVDAALSESLEAANAIEPMLRDAGYEQTVQGDWFRW